jgi:hypothetical protein
LVSAQGLEGEGVAVGEGEPISIYRTVIIGAWTPVKKTTTPTTTTTTTTKTTTPTTTTTIKQAPVG